jgi:hypothetical protein
MEDITANVSLKKDKLSIPICSLHGQPLQKIFQVSFSKIGGFWGDEKAQTFFLEFSNESCYILCRNKGCHR